MRSSEGPSAARSSPSSSTLRLFLALAFALACSLPAAPGTTAGVDAAASASAVCAASRTGGRRGESRRGVDVDDRSTTHRRARSAAVAFRTIEPALPAYGRAVGGGHFPRVLRPSRGGAVVPPPRSPPLYPSVSLASSSSPGMEYDDVDGIGGFGAGYAGAPSRPEAGAEEGGRPRRRRAVVLSFDGAVAATARHRARSALRAALEVWPSLRRDVAEMSDDSDRKGDDADEDFHPPMWLENKLAALAPAVQHGTDPDDMLGCGAAFLARLVLEEQHLDGGRSPGTGKYGSKFHPPRSGSAGGGDDDDNGSSSANGSRPLTVGEIRANWEDLKEVARMRYGVDGEDPLPLVREALLRQYESFEHDGDDAEGAGHTPAPPALHAAARKALLSARDDDVTVVVLASHESHVPMAMRSLEDAGLRCTRAAAGGRFWNAAPRDGRSADGDDDDARERESLGRSDGATVAIVTAPRSDGAETHADVIRRIVSEADDGTDLRVVHGAMSALKRSKCFLGDDAPPLVDGVRTCTVDSREGNEEKKTAVSLFLPDWADTVDAAQRNDAEMDTWLNVLSEKRFAEYCEPPC